MSGSERPHRINEVNRNLGPLTHKRDKEHLHDKKVAPQGAWSLLPILNEPFTLLYQLAVFKLLVYLRIPHATLYKPFQSDPFLSLQRPFARQGSFSSSVTKRPRTQAIFFTFVLTFLALPILMDLGKSFSVKVIYL